MLTPRLDWNYNGTSELNLTIGENPGIDKPEDKKT